jgi:hypothetical protein
MLSYLFRGITPRIKTGGIMEELGHGASRWHVSQDNGYQMTWNIHRDGHRLSGQALLPNDDALRAGYAGAITQEFHGQIEQDELRVRIVWPAKRDGSHAIGIYKGRMHSGKIEGLGHDELDPRHPVYPWHAVQG